LLDVRFVLRAYDHLCPLFLGDAKTPGLRLHLDHHAPLTLDIPQDVDVAEISLNRYLVGASRGDDRMVGLPAFILRGPASQFLRARREPLHPPQRSARPARGHNAWPDTGTMWVRAALRDSGVEVGDVQWVLGQLDPYLPNKEDSSYDAPPPGNAEYLRAGDYLLDALRDGRIDAMTVAFAPDDVFKSGGSVRRLVQNYREVEQDYYRRTGIYPAFHIVAARREFAEQQPWALLVIYKALQQILRSVGQQGQKIC
jgi:4,5-dihydroxyphthalate decarboxylase